MDMTYTGKKNGAQFHSAVLSNYLNKCCDTEPNEQFRNVFHSAYTCLTLITLQTGDSKPTVQTLN